MIHLRATCSCRQTENVVPDEVAMPPLVIKGGGSLFSLCYFGVFSEKFWLLCIISPQD